MFHVIFFFFKKHSGMCETKTVKAAPSLNLLDGGGFWKNQVQTGKTVGHQSEAKS